MARLLTALRATYEVKLYQWLATMLAILALMFVAITGTVRFVNDQRADSERAATAAAYVAARASYENARDERARCELSVATRDDLRGVFAAIFAAIEQGQEPSEVVTRMRTVLEQDYAARSLDECPPEPVAPVPPPAD